MKKVFLTILIGMFIATGLSAKALAEGKMKVSVSAGYTMINKDMGNKAVGINQLDISQNNGIAFLSPQAAGLAFSYGISKDLTFMYSMPLFQMKMFTQPFLSDDGGDKDISATRTLGSPLLGVIYHKNLGNLGLRVAPYLGVPFIEMLGNSIDGKEIVEKDENGDEVSHNFKQQTLVGVSMAIDSKMKGKMFWQGWLNLQTGFGGDIDMTMTTILSGLIGYKVAKGQMTKIQLFWITPNLMNDTDDAPGFADGWLKIKAVYGMKLNKTSGIHAGLWTKMGFTDKAKTANFVGGFTLDYWITF